MSYERSSALESQPTTWRREDDPQYADDPEFQRFSTELSERLFTLTSTVSRLSNEIGLLGTRRETERVRERVKDLIEEGSREFKEVGESLKKVISWPDVGPSQRFTQGKLNREFQASLKEFQDLQRAALDKERAAAAASRAVLDEQSTSPGGTSGQRQQQQQQEQLRLASQEEVDFQESLIIERESEIRNIEQSVSELNELFRDVANIIHEQGEQLDIIQENVVDTRDQNMAAHRELNSAAKYQRNARNKMCCLLLILAVLLTIIILAVVLG